MNNIGDYCFDFTKNSFDDCIMSSNGSSFYIIKQCKKTFKLYKLNQFTKNIDTRYKTKRWTKNQIMNHIFHIFLTLDECLNHYAYINFLNDEIKENNDEYKKKFLNYNNVFNKNELIEDTETDEPYMICLSA
jgi:hypothetical protein